MFLFDFHGDLEICLFINRIELTTKYREIVIQKLLCVSRNLDPEK